VSARGPITTHILDLGTGRPAEGVAVELERWRGEDGWETLGRGVSDADGRIQHLLPAGTLLATASHRLRFAIAAYFEAANRETFYPEVAIAFSVCDPTQHYHVPLLLSPFGYSTYRGS
jgi:5-hydroxyisourate hydrolase